MNTARDCLDSPLLRLAVPLRTEKHEIKEIQCCHTDTIKSKLNGASSRRKTKSAINLIVGEAALAGNATRIALFASDRPIV